jgi:bifunctional non-homologous end joining protein LigD
MPKVRPRSAFVAPCIPTRALKPPAGPEWVHEIKHDGYRLQVRRVGDQVRLFTRRGYDWSARYPAIAVTATLLRARSFTLDGEAVVCGPDGVAIFDALHRRGTVTEAMLYAFDLLELDGEDLRTLPLGDRKKRLARLLGGRRLGIVLSDHTDDDGATIFRHACKLGLQGIVSKRLTAPYRSGPSRDWLAGLAQGQEPGQSRNDPSAGSRVVMQAREKRKPPSRRPGPSPRVALD